MHQLHGADIFFESVMAVLTGNDDWWTELGVNEVACVALEFMIEHVVN